MSRIRLTLLLLVALASSLPAHADSPGVQSPALPEANPKKAPGLILTFLQGEQTDSRESRHLALHIPADTIPSPFLSKGPFTARWEGFIASPLRADHSFQVRVRGHFKLTLNGTQILDTHSPELTLGEPKRAQLNKGANLLVAEFTPEPAGDATVQLLWSSSEFPLEPVPSILFTHESATPALRSGNRLREGRLLFAQLRCAACHADPILLPAPTPGEAMPELAQDAPVFADLGAKFNAPWLAHWINDPHSTRPHALMPRVFSAPEGTIAQEAADLAAFLLSSGTRNDQAPSDDLAPAGGALFANLGCIACHTPPDFNGNDEHARTPLAHLKAKWQPTALAAFLKEPAKNYRWTHMPNFRLTDEEAAQLTSFLLSGTQRDFPPTPNGDPARGAQRLVSSGCLNCHAGLPPTTQPTLSATLQSGWIKGCMAPQKSARGSAPDFALTDSQRDALRTFAASGFESLRHDTPAEFADRQTKAMRCTACHSRDGAPSTWSQLDDETAPLQAAAPQPEGEGNPVATTALPLFHWFGEKLQPSWMARFITGEPLPKPRPWLIARMPGFPAVGEGIAHGLSHSHGLSLTSPPEPPPAEEHARNGATLLAENGGFNCTTCHGVGERPPTAVFEAPGINLAWASQRLRKDYFQRWLLHPLRIDPETKMPRFADEDGRTQLTDLYEGRARDQFDAIWQYLRTQAPQPQKSQAAQ